MRGTPLPSAQSLTEPGNTPAYAGNTPRPRFVVSVNQEHPRVCGEHPNPNSPKLFEVGTPPRMRGTQ